MSIDDDRRRHRLAVRHAPGPRDTHRVVRGGRRRRGRVPLVGPDDRVPLGSGPDERADDTLDRGSPLRRADRRPPPRDATHDLGDAAKHGAGGARRLHPQDRGERAEADRDPVRRGRRLGVRRHRPGGGGCRSRRCPDRRTRDWAQAPRPRRAARGQSREALRGDDGAPYAPAPVRGVRGARPHVGAQPGRGSARSTSGYRAPAGIRSTGPNPTTSRARPR